MIRKLALLLAATVLSRALIDIALLRVEPGDVIQRVLNGPVGSVREFWQLVDGERWVTLPSA